MTKDAEELVRLQKTLGATFVHVTHDQEEAMSIADRIIVMNRGRIEDMGKPDRIYLRPASLFAARFMGESNIIDGRVVETRGGDMGVATALGDLNVPGNAAPGTAVHLALRPEQLLLEAPTQGMRLGEAATTEISFQGTHQRCRCHIGETELILRAPVTAGITAGSRVPLFARISDVVVLTH